MTKRANIKTEPYFTQAARWPADGRHILANHDTDTILVYQAYRPSIAARAISTRTFGGEFDYKRMSWIKPNFLWMMFRSGWGTKPDQEIVLALKLRRCFFDSLLSLAVPSSYDSDAFSSQCEWKEAIAASSVRLQWDPDHDPYGKPLKRRAIQLGLRGDALQAFGMHEILEVVDMTEFVAAQREQLSGGDLAGLALPFEEIYRPRDENTARRLRLDEYSESQQK